jgi:hypothetical protein
LQFRLYGLPSAIGRREKRKKLLTHGKQQQQFPIPIGPYLYYSILDHLCFYTLLGCCRGGKPYKMVTAVASLHEMSPALKKRFTLSSYFMRLTQADSSAKPMIISVYFRPVC